MSPNQEKCANELNTAGLYASWSPYSFEDQICMGLLGQNFITYSMIYAFIKSYSCHQYFESAKKYGNWLILLLELVTS